jgi:hypothetical protein
MLSRLLKFPNPYKSVPQGSVGLVSRFGQFYKSVDPGLVKVNVTSENLRMVDVKIQLSTVPKQAVMTKDNGAFSRGVVSLRRWDLLEILLPDIRSRSTVSGTFKFDVCCSHRV